jgi:beta-mannosidase
VVPFVPTKHLKLSDPELRTTVRETDEGFEIEVAARRLARFVWLALAGTEVIFSDNYFDLPAGRTATVTLPALEGWTAERIREALRVRSLVDSF